MQRRPDHLIGYWALEMAALWEEQRRHQVGEVVEVGGEEDGQQPAQAHQHVQQAPVHQPAKAGVQLLVFSSIDAQPVDH